MTTSHPTETSRPPTGSLHPWRWQGGLIVVFLALVLYSPMAGFSFVNWDDPLHVSRNPSVVTPSRVSWREWLAPKRLGYPIPVTMLSYHLDRSLYGAPGTKGALANGKGAHISQLVWWLLLLLALYALFGALLGDWRFACFGVLLCMSHPAVIEPVAWISGRKDVLSGLWSVMALWAWFHGLRSPSRLWLWGAGCFGFLALGSKPNAVYLLPIMAWMWWRMAPAAGIPRRRQIGLGLCFGTLGAAAAAVVAWGMVGQRAVGAVQSFDMLTIARRAWWALGFHSSLLLAPFGLRPRYFSHPTAADRYDLLALLVLVCALGLLVVLWRRHQGKGVLSFAILWACLAYLPNSSLMPLVRYTSDTYVFVSWFGVALLVAAWLQRLCASLSRWGHLIWGACGLVVSLLFVLSSQQLPSWRSSAALWAHSYRLQPHPRNCMMLAHAFVQDRDLKRATRAYQGCMKIHGRRIFAINLAIVYVMQRRFKEAKPLLRWVADHTADPRAFKYLSLIQQTELARRRQPARSKRRHPAPTSRPASRPTQ